MPWGKGGRIEGPPALDTKFVGKYNYFSCIANVPHKNKQNPKDKTNRKNYDPDFFLSIISPTEIVIFIWRIQTIILSLQSHLGGRLYTVDNFKIE